ncbi:hypothetical protein [Parabacteroides sp. PF5-6]|uniref:hypothetical protein n=1 Tax=Parabacteroides sp. PF5-6 TaxID=1742403 RepID=UPI0024071319|nr:hypothetical protein [Parabacteroides sp. PF5-6]MDF9828838.1 hypothetical protein [Parabacteroides sp. PF5-6]
MKKEEDVFRQFHDSFSQLEGHFHILEQRVPVKVQMEYFKCSEEIRKQVSPDSLTEEKVNSLFDLLEIPDSSVKEKKHLLTTLAISKSVKAYRLLEDYVRHPDDRLVDWAYMALMESRISLESEFSNEKQIYISTGLGGKEGRLRFYVLFIAKDRLPFQEYQCRVIEREFPYQLSHADCEIERLTIKTNHVEMIFLVPVRADIKGILDKVISECNQYGDFLANMFTITNVKELSESEVADIISQDGND